MNKYIFLVTIGLGISGCQSASNDEYLTSSKIKNDTIYDIIKGEYVHETEDTLWFEPFEKKIPKLRRIFRKGKNYTYQAIYKNANGTILSNSEIKLTPSNKRIGFASAIQDKVTYEFKEFKKDRKTLKDHTINPTYDNWVLRQDEGIVENFETVWIHPFRSNQYKFTEVAPFPRVQFPLKIGKEWNSNLNIGKGWGEWGNTSGSNNYIVVNKTNYKIDSIDLECWVIQSRSDYSFGSSQLNYKFNEEFGFMEMNYVNYENETLDIKMTKVEIN